MKNRTIKILVILFFFCSCATKQNRINKFSQKGYSIYRDEISMQKTLTILDKNNIQSVKIDNRQKKILIKSKNLNSSFTELENIVRDLKIEKKLDPKIIIIDGKLYLLEEIKSFKIETSAVSSVTMLKDSITQNLFCRRPGDILIIATNR